MSSDRFLILLVALFFSTILSGCSLVLDLEQCQSESDCSATSQCVEGLCQEAQREVVTSHIVEDTTWTSDKVYVLDELILVIAPAVLTIEPGTVILGQRNTGLVSLAGARLEAVGTRDEPIVFTSDKPVGQRIAGDWAGVAMVGNARTNRENFDLRILPEEYDARVGGDDDEWNCGTARYVRIEFGGSEINGYKALNGLTLAGCGSETTVEYVQSHMSDDDGIAVFGGTVDVRNIVSTRAGDDGFDFDTAWRGTAQFLAVQQGPNSVEAIEVENIAEEPDATPQTDAQIYNFTILGAPSGSGRQIGLFVKFGGLGTFSHGLVTGPRSAGLYIDGAEAADHGRNGDIVVQDTLFYDIGAEGDDYFAMEDDGVAENDEGEEIVWEPFVDYADFEEESLNNVFGVDPEFLGDPYDLSNPDWVATASEITNSAIDDPPEERFDHTAVYRGAFHPTATPWTEGWTAYPRH